MLKKILICAAFLLPAIAHGHVGHHASVHDTVAAIIERLRKSGRAEEAMRWKAAEAEHFLTSQEREILANEHIRFTVDQPVRVFVVRGKDPAEELFWLESRGFAKSDLSWTEEKVKLTTWQRDFAAGEIGLGVNSLTGGGTHYSVILQPLQPGAAVRVSDLYPGRLRATTLKNGSAIYSDIETKFTAVPNSITGATLIQTVSAARNDGKLLDIFRRTKHPATTRPDQVILTWSDDPRTTQTIQWRTSAKVKNGSVKFQRKRDASPLHSSRRSIKTVKALTERLTTLTLINNPIVNRHTAVLRELEPDTAYIYSVGSGGADGWSEEFEFTTAPAEAKPFSFMYMGDAQNGLDRWGSLLKSAYLNRPDAAFYIMAGDLVNRGADRDDWDDLFHNSAGIYDRRQLVPVIGNHEMQGGHPTLYLKQLAVLTNGPTNIEKERAYSFEYSNALFVVLDSNLPAATQTNWLARTLENSKATWKFVTYHHPAYSSGPKRDNKGVRDLWTPIFDKYHVDLALQGHDHAYLRTYPMKDKKKVASAADGTIYIVSVSGTKFYEQGKFEYTAFGMTNVATIQTLDIQISGDRLLYRSYDIDRKLRDEFVIEKKTKTP
jgi:acid phosphatase type 7